MKNKKDKRIFNILDDESEKLKIILTPDHKKKIQYKIKKINYKRLIIFGILTFVLEAALICFNDIPSLLNENSRTFISIMYFALHFLMFISSLAVVILLKFNKNNPDGKICNYIAEVAAFAGTMCMAGIGILDEYTIGRITSYITILVVFGMAILIRPPRNYIIYSITHLTFLYLTIRISDNPEFMMDIIVNSTLFYFCVLFVSKVLYENISNQIAKNILLEEANRKLQYISNYDFLTDLYNRRYFENILNEKIFLNQYYENKKLVVGIIDIDQFKLVNDEYGHKAGDEVIKEVAKIIFDNIEEGNMVARWGGEEFIVLFPEISVKESHSIVSKIKTEIENNRVNFENYLISVTASIGMSEIYGNTEKDFTNGFKKADQALYLAKENGRNRIEWLIDEL